MSVPTCGSCAKELGLPPGPFIVILKIKKHYSPLWLIRAIKGLQKRYDTAGDKCFDFVSVENISQLWSVSIDTMAEFIRYIFKNFDAFKLLLHCSDGTKYVDFTDWMVEKEVEDSLKLYEVLEQKNIPFHKLTVKEMHMLYHSYYSCIFETVLHDYTEEEALQCTNTLAKFFTAGWREAHGL